MDPLLAARLYNNRHCPLPSLPNEILLYILRYLADDILSLHCLRRVCSIFRRFLDVGMMRRLCTPRNIILGSMGYRLEPKLQAEFMQYLERDGLCNQCKEKGKISYYCPFKLRNGFVAVRSDKHFGRHGAVQLCEHRYITWSTIENHIMDWWKRCKQEGVAMKWKECCDSFLIECDDPSHNRPCRRGGTPTRPRARLQEKPLSRGVTLSLDWDPHHRIPQEEDGRIPAAKLKDILGKYRDGPGGILLPAYPSNQLPELACLSPGKYKWNGLYLEGEDVGGDLGNRGKRTPPRTKFMYMRRKGFQYEDAEMVKMDVHASLARKGKKCIMTTYRRVMLICGKKDIGKGLPPTHAWLHAMDPKTYGNDPFGLCWDTNCMRYCCRPRATTTCGGERPVTGYTHARPSEISLIGSAI